MDPEALNLLTKAEEFPGRVVAKAPGVTGKSADLVLPAT
jgi:hypothetical protein